MPADGGATPIERATPADLVMRAMDARSASPEHLGGVLVLDAGPGFDVSALERLLAARAAQVPRLRQRLVPLPPGCGRPIWLDDGWFDAGAHVRRVRCPAPGDEQALLELAAAIVSEPLPPTRPLWSAVVVTALAGDRTAVVLVVHHVLADGLGGLAVLVRLVDPGPGDTVPPPAPPPPRARPSLGRLVADALSTDSAALRRLPGTWRDLRRAMGAGGGLRSEPATPCSLLGRTRGRSRLAVARAELARLREAAHREGGTVNDAVLCAVGGALRTLLEHRGEAVESFRVTVMVSARRSADPAVLGNQVTPLLVSVPGNGPPAERLRRIAGTVGRAREQATGPPVVSLLGPLFRGLGRLGLYRLYMAHQRRMHTLVSNVPGPGSALTVAGAPVTTIVPVAVGESGNVTVSFVVLSYAGTVTVSVVADGTVPDLPVLVGALQAELDELVSAPAARRG